jgi:hypothetical protein
MWMPLLVSYLRFINDRLWCSVFVTSPVAIRTVCTTAHAFFQVKKLQNLEQWFKFPVSGRASVIIGHIFHVYKLPCQLLTGFFRLEDTKSCALPSATHWLLISIFVPLLFFQI